MRKIILSAVFTLVSVSCFSQNKIYSTAGTESIFSFASIDDKGHSESSIIRYAPVFNLQIFFNYDANKHVGFFTVIAIRNVGYIYDNYKTPTVPEITYKKKFRSYNLGVPLGFKLGNLEKAFFYAGYEVEVPVHYKEKTFDGGDKIDKLSGWFSDRQELFQHGGFAGMQFGNGLNLKFKYYVSEFHNQDFKDGEGHLPYAGLKSNIFYFSLSAFMFKNFKYDSGKSPDEKNMDAMNW